jgi:hypothetical protein
MVPSARRRMKRLSPFGAISSRFAAFYAMIASALGDALDMPERGHEADTCPPWLGAALVWFVFSARDDADIRQPVPVECVDPF